MLCRVCLVGLFRVVQRVQVVAMRGVRMFGRFGVVRLAMGLGGFAMVFGGVLMMIGGVIVMVGNAGASWHY